MSPYDEMTAIQRAVSNEPCLTDTEPSIISSEPRKRIRIRCRFEKRSVETTVRKLIAESSNLQDVELALLFAWHESPEPLYELLAQTTEENAATLYALPFASLLSTASPISSEPGSASSSYFYSSSLQQQLSPLSVFLMMLITLLNHSSKQHSLEA
ncbi:uncharacterized protein MONOS_8549 [Monocercomonoides exilis]|uniref:uncharacterized protein n=1 Tax=Monocercomonoides exilis TaxID=2049356 RepID=UPI00355A1DFA|nr:hypothetical protein MONOS_8549 [Monocercomonoides exilis]|eukprot:MONOS_8549.1-p1 / transcript=MONOS_8549.1 / gene=MONOS_8549 / organism=Monocercomonoides_exilis_PA203 / gene_product=unspecified product / transcript_product=unspecified product / location=Mono_scaffold00325:20117-20584(+) / protein_length=156 / sequence_SO=supercontig / SO=protein_coding / is_pseudo=false